VVCGAIAPGRAGGCGFAPRGGDGSRRIACSRQPLCFGHAGPNGAAEQSDRITILVSHRSSTVRKADLVVVLDGSRVVEVGRRETLVAKGGEYAELYEIQAAA
jgi:hypothetical protein